MALRPLTARAARRWAALPAVVRIAAIYLVARAATVSLVLLAAALGPVDGQLAGPNPLGRFTLAWDAQWYWLVAVDGYPAELPVDADGAVAQNAWAFMPVYAFVAQGVGLVLGGNWGIGAFLVSFVSGYAACLLLFRLIRHRQGDRQALWAVVLFAAGPLAPLFHVGYAESLFLVELLAALLCVVRRHWWPLYPLVAVMAFTRPGLQAFALMLAMYGVWRWFRRRSDPLPARDTAHIVAVGLIAAAAGFAWQAVAAAVTGDPGAYLDTELAWRRSWVGTEAFVPTEGWFSAAEVWFGVWGLPGSLAPVAVVAVVAAAAALVALPRSVRRMGPELRMWTASYLIYLLLVFFPQSSVFRLLAPLAPLSGAAAAVRFRGVPAPATRAALLVAGTVGQWLWVWFMWGNGTTYWQVP